MESIHGVDVSWLHHSGKDHHHGRKDKHTKSPSESTTNSKASKTSPIASRGPDQTHSSGDSSPVSPRLVSRRPGDGGNLPTERIPAVQNVQRSSSPARKGSSWLSSLSSKFSSTPLVQTATLSPSSVTVPARSPSPKLVLSPGMKSDSIEKPYTPAPPKSSQTSFLQSALRRLSSSGGGLSGSGKGSVHGLCERRTLNIDRDRERCDIPDLNLSKLRRVAFCVDVEIAGGPHYNDEDDEESKAKRQKKKLAEKGEGEALKKSEAGAELKKDSSIANSDQVQKGAGQSTDQEGVSESPPEISVDDQADEPGEKESKKKEKKRRSEEERKARKEKRKKQAQINGSLPVELTRSGSDNSIENSLTGTSTPLSQASPTTDPVRIYRRCCQLRETPILKKITEQLANPANCRINQPGYVDKLDLTNFPMTLADLMTLGDYFAVVPIKDVILENCGLTDEGTRVVLAGLLATKKPEYGRRRRRHTLERVARQSRQGGVVERLILKNNPKLGRAGWSHISLFVNMCRSIRYLDLSMNPFPSSSPLDVLNKLERVNTRDSIPDTSSILSRALGGRHAKAELELLNMAETGLDTDQLGELIDGVIKSGLKRLGIAGNHITAEGMDHIARYIKDGKCEGLDIGGNDIAEQLTKIADSLDENHPLWALSLADVNLTPDALWKLFPALAKLPNLKFIDLSHNHGVFEKTPSSLSLLRRYLPKMQSLKRIHLSDTSMTAAQAIALAEILPESPSIAHVIMLENPAITALASAKTEQEQEEACALYASLMAAVRVSKALICIDVDVPSPESSEIVKALAKQVVAYCLRNMERGPVAEIDQAAKALTEPHHSEVPMPDVLLHIVGHTDDSSKNCDDEPAPDEDYIIGGTGVAKALNICLRNSGSDLRRPRAERTLSNASQYSMDALASTTPTSGGKAKDMSKNLLDSARKIRARLHPAMLQKDQSNDNFNRLQFLDNTLESMIQRFEDEYPETRLGTAVTPPPISSPANGSPSGDSILSNHLDDPEDTVQIGAPASDEETELNLNISLRPNLSRHNSEVSLVSKAQHDEEGRMHRVGQQFRRDILKPVTPNQVHSPDSFSSSPNSNHLEASGNGDSPSKSKIDEVFNTDRRHDPQHLQMLRAMVEEVGGEEFQKRMEEGGEDDLVKELEDDAGLLRRRLMEQDPEAWEKFREAQVKAQRNSMVAPSIDFGEKGDEEVGTTGQLPALENMEDESAIESD